MLLSIESLSVRLPRKSDRPYAVKALEISLQENEILCVVGESGSGKSVTASAILGLLPPELQVETGRIMFDGRDLTKLSPAELRKIRGAGIGMIFQDPMTALNPLQRVGNQIAETFRVHTKLSRGEVQQRVIRLLTDMHLPDPVLVARAYPHELSGGQRQRAMIAMALALEPRILIADEPTTALDVTTQAQILSLIRELQHRNRMGVLFITHDFGVVAEIGNRIAVMRMGELVELGTAEQILARPQHEYTKTLLRAVPSLKPPNRPAPPEEPVGHAALSVLSVQKTYRRGLRRVVALRDVTLHLRRGTTLGIVGESGSGKSTLARCIVRLLKTDSGVIEIGGEDITRMTKREWRREARRVQMVFQDPYASLNPRRRAGELVAQGPVVHGARMADVMPRVRELFGLVGLDPNSVDRFPHEFSGGQRQRIALARSLAMDPEILVADEPVSALDVSVQAQVLELLADLQRRLNLSMIFITHDLRVAAQICDRVAIMQRGEVVEEGEASQVLVAPQHPYAKALIAAVPGREWAMRREPI